MWRSIFVGALALAGLQAIVSTDAAAKRFGGLLTGIGDVARHFLSPYEPAIPDLRKRTSPPPPPGGGMNRPPGRPYPVRPRPEQNGTLA